LLRGAELEVGTVDVALALGLVVRPHRPRIHHVLAAVQPAVREELVCKLPGLACHGKQFARRDEAVHVLEGFPSVAVEAIPSEDPGRFPGRRGCKVPGSTAEKKMTAEAKSSQQLWLQGHFANAWVAKRDGEAYSSKLPFSEAAALMNWSIVMQPSASLRESKRSWSNLSPATPRTTSSSSLRSNDAATPIFSAVLALFVGSRCKCQESYVNFITHSFLLAFERSSVRAGWPVDEYSVSEAQAKYLDNRPVDPTGRAKRPRIGPDAPPPC